MSPDRDLTKEEMMAFLSERGARKGKFNALEAIMNENTKPTLHDLCITELFAIVEGQKWILIEQGRELKRIKAKIKYCEFMNKKKENKQDG